MARSKQGITSTSESQDDKRDRLESADFLENKREREGTAVFPTLEQ